MIITTKNVKIKEYGPDDIKKMITTNKTKPEKFKIKGKAAPRQDITITTANMEEHQETRKKEVKEETRKANVRQKKLNEEIKVQEKIRAQEKPQDTNIFANLRR